MTRLALVVAVVSAIAVAAAAGRAGRAAAVLTPAQQSEARYVDAHDAEARALLTRVVNVNSGTENLAGVKRVGDVFRAEFDALGFTTRWIDGAAWHRAGHLIADHPGPGPRVLLIGHLDTVFAPESPFQSVQPIDADTARGPGIIDMKGGDVIILQALKALQSAGRLSAQNVVVVMTGDEEAPGDPLTAARAPLVEAAKGAAVAIGFEDGDGDPSHLVVARRGTTSWVLRVTGTPAHSSQIFSPDVGPGAIFEAARILSAFRETLAGEAHLTLNPGAIVGGTTADLDPATSKGNAFGKTNVVAEHAVVTGDLRALTPQQFEHATSAMRAIVAGASPRTSATLMFDDGYPPLAPQPGNERLLAAFDEASRDLGLGPVTAVSPDKAGAADVSFVAGEVPMIIDAAGLKGHDDHTAGETADLKTLALQTKRAAILLDRIASGLVTTAGTKGVSEANEPAERSGERGAPRATAPGGGPGAPGATTGRAPRDRAGGAAGGAGGPARDGAGGRRGEAPGDDGRNKGSERSERAAGAERGARGPASDGAGGPRGEAPGQKMTRQQLHQALFVALAVLTIGCDHVTKHVASETLAGRGMRSFLADTVRLQYVENPGGFLSLGATWPPLVRVAVFSGLSAVLLVVLLTVAVRRRWSIWPMAGVILCVAGGASNWIDRIAAGRVVDFLNVGYGPVRTGIFNIADVAVMAGGLLLLVAMGNQPESPTEPADPGSPPTSES